MTFDSFHRDYVANQQRWGSVQFHDRLFAWRAMAKGVQRYEASDVERARKILARHAELVATGLDKVSALRLAETEHPPKREK